MSRLNTEVYNLILAQGPITFNQLTEQLFRDETYDKRQLERKVLFRILGGLMKSYLVSVKTNTDGDKVFYPVSAGRTRYSGRARKHC